jgi:[ribosomal protein S5]-alanine N-acetyltransferase
MPADPFDSLDGFPVLTTERLLLRQVTLNDAEWYLAYFSKPEIVRGQGYAPPADLEAARGELTRYFIDSLAEHWGLRWGLALREQAVEAARAPLIGSAGYYGFDPEAHVAELGADLSPEHWGRGLMSEALTAIIDFGFERLEVNRVQALILPHNVRSRRMVARLGFTEEGTLREHGLDEHGRPCDDVMYSLLRREWRRGGHS